MVISKKSKRIFKWVLLPVLIFLAYQFLWLFDPIIAPIYDIVSQQESVSTFPDNHFEQLPFEELPQKEKDKHNNCACGSFKYNQKKFIKISWFDRYKNIAKDRKIYKFITPDRLFGAVRIPHMDKTQYLLIEKSVINSFIVLLNTLEKKGYDTHAIQVTSGYRNPSYNKAVKGARCSQHQIGSAIDIYVGDINKDGETNINDRKIVYKILDTQIIKNKGGLGTYKSNDQVIHFDTRGNRARWLN